MHDRLVENVQAAVLLIVEVESFGRFMSQEKGQTDAL
jgi:hypothetical protein